MRPPKVRQLEIVVSPAHFGCVFVPAGRGPDTPEFISDHGHAHTRPADEDGPVELPVQNGLDGLDRVIHVIHALARPAAEILVLDIVLGKIGNDALFQQKPGMIRGNGYLHVYPLRIKLFTPSPVEGAAFTGYRL